MDAALLVVSLWSSMSSQNLEGQATYYSHGLMERVAENRGMDLTGYMGGIALNRKGDLGRVVWLEWDDAVEGPFLVVDCAQRNHYKSRGNRVVEVDAETAKRHGFFGVGPVPVKVFFYDSVSCTGLPCFE